MTAWPTRRLIVTGSEDDGDISLASTLNSPPLGEDQLQWQQQRPSQLRRASSHGHGTAGRGGHRKRNSTLTRVNDLPTALLPTELLARLKEWIEAVVIVNFDLDRGPEFDNCYPPMTFSAIERNSIAFSSFPDHNEKGDSTLTFSWRIPRLREDGTTPRDTILHGYCFFCQQKNASIRRGYAQRSLVIITKHPGLAGLFTKLVDILGQMYFRERGGGSVTVETATYNICRWPPPSSGTLELAFLNHILSVEIPLPHQAQYRLPRSSSHLHLSSLPPPSPASIPVLASLPSTPISELLRELISQLWLIWELIILAEPILVYSTDPRRASEIVQWLVTIIRPLPFAGDWRPFFHIHTPDYAQLLNNNKPRPGTLLGATNPLILSGARHYPHILRIGPPPSSLLYPEGAVHGVFGSLAKSPAGQSFKEASTTTPGLFSERKRHIKKDTTVLKIAEEKVKAGDFSGADSHLLQCMSTLTERFLVPLNRYFATLLPADASDGMSMPNRTQTFSHAGFLQSLKTHGTPLTFRRGKMPSMSINSSNDSTATASAISFYERFLKSPNFLSWLRDRSETMQTTARDRYLQRLQTGNPETYLRGKGPAEMSDLIERLESEARITEEELQQTPTIARQRSASYDVNMHTLLADPRSGQALKERSTRLRSQVERVKAIRQATLESSEDSDASSMA